MQIKGLSKQYKNALSEIEDLEKEQHEKSDRLIKQINGENAFYWRAN